MKKPDTLAANLCALSQAQLVDPDLILLCEDTKLLAHPSIASHIDSIINTDGNTVSHVSENVANDTERNDGRHAKDASDSRPPQTLVVGLHPRNGTFL